MSGDYFLTTQRLGLRCWRREDEPLLQALWGDIEVTRFAFKEGRLDTNQVHGRLVEEIARAASTGLQYWPVFRLADDVHVGCCGLRPYARGNLLELGFYIARAHWRQGYATEASRAVMAYAFDTLGAPALFAGHHPENKPSRGVLLKLGFQHVRDELYEPTGLIHPSYELTAGEFSAQSA